MGHTYDNDLNSAWFLWKSIPEGIKKSRPEIVAAWKIGQCLWTQDYTGVYGAVRGFEWSHDAVSLVTAFSEGYTKKMFNLLVSAYSTISVADVAHFMGMTEDEAICIATWLVIGFVIRDVDCEESKYHQRAETGSGKITTLD